jgi:hypothetical protein
MKLPDRDKALRVGIASLHLLFVVPIALLVLGSARSPTIITICWFAIFLPEMIILLLWWNDIQPP